MKQYTLSILLCFFFFQALWSQIDFMDISLDEAITKAKSEDKYIFIDVYTTWCGPCKKLDKETFQDSEVGDYVNSNFIPVKWDAESEEHESEAKSFSVRSFPTMLYLDSSGNLASRQTGFQGKNQLLEFAENLLDILEDKELMSLLSNIDNLEHAERKELLLTLLDIEHPDKEGLFNEYYEQVTVLDSLVSDDRNILIDNFNRHSLHMFDQILSSTKAPDRNSFSPLKDAVKNEMAVKKVLWDAQNHAISTSDYDLLLTTFDMESRWNDISIQKVNTDVVNKQRQTKLLHFYKKSGDTEKYASLADSLVTKYITAYSAQEFKEEDEKMYEFNKKFASLMSKEEVTEQEVEEDESYEIKYSFSTKAADRLIDISKTYLKLLDPSDNRLQKTKVWSKMATELYPKPKSYINYAEVMIFFNENDKAKKILEKTLSLESISKEEMSECQVLLEN